MPWIEGEFTINTNSNGLIRNEQYVAVTLLGKLKKYELKTITGCHGRSHTPHLLITRVNNPTDKLEINVDIKDCLNLREIDPPCRIRREEYDARLTAIGFDADERVEGVAGVFYTFFFELDLDTLDGGELISSTAESVAY